MKNSMKADEQPPWETQKSGRPSLSPPCAAAQFRNPTKVEEIARNGEARWQAAAPGGGRGRQRKLTGLPLGFQGYFCNLRGWV